MKIRVQPIFFIALTVVITAVIAFLSAGCSSSTGGSDEDITPPPVPTDLEITKIDNGSATLTWQAVTDRGLKGYYVYWIGGAEVDTLNANRRFYSTTTATISGLDYETIYHFAVSSIDKSGNESALSVQERGKPLNTTSPAPPNDIDLVAENIDYPIITVFWQENQEPDVAYYNIYRALTVTGLNDSTSFVASLTQTSYTDIDVETGANYYYRVTAVDKGGWESIPSAIVNDYVLPKVELLSPVGFNYTSGTPTFSWKEVSGAKKYNLVLTTSRIGGEIWNIEVDESVTEIAYSGKTKLISGNTYYWRIGAISRKEINSISDVGMFVVQNQ